MIAIIQYNAGNTRSVQNALSRLGVESRVTDDSGQILTADKVIFPGVGEANSAMHYLKERGLDATIKKVRQPFLGICLGLQLMCQRSAERNTTCLGIFQETVEQFPVLDKVPHMGWNNLTQLQGPLFANLPVANDMYFVHSFYAVVGEHTSAVTEYIVPFSAGLERDNFYGVQFHPEKSAHVGARILKNFLEL